MLNPHLLLHLCLREKHALPSRRVGGQKVPLRGRPPREPERLLSRAPGAGGAWLAEGEENGLLDVSRCRSGCGKIQINPAFPGLLGLLGSKRGLGLHEGWPSPSREVRQGFLEGADMLGVSGRLKSRVCAGRGSSFSCMKLG